jgi:hypothetical protein
MVLLMISIEKNAEIKKLNAKIKKLETQVESSKPTPPPSMYKVGEGFSHSVRMAGYLMLNRNVPASAVGASMNVSVGNMNADSRL